MSWPACRHSDLQAPGNADAKTAAIADIDRTLMHRVAAIASGGRSGLPYNGAVVTLLATIFVLGTTLGSS